jgi:fructose-1-phosphate kinase PfkB-like protein
MLDVALCGAGDSAVAGFAFGRVAAVEKRYCTGSERT